MNQAFFLYQLQKADSLIDRIDRRLDEINKIISNDVRIKSQEKRILAAENSLEKAAKKLKKTEEEVKTLRIKQENCEENLYSGRIKNPKELQDLQNELKSIKKRILEIEEKQLEEMILVEEQENLLKTENSKLQITKAGFISSQSVLLGEKTKIEKEKEQLISEKKANLTSILPESLEVYNKLRTQKNGLAVAIIEDKACSICGATLPPAEWQAARSPLKIVFCSSCGRILYAG